MFVAVLVIKLGCNAMRLYSSLNRFDDFC